MNDRELDRAMVDAAFRAARVCMANGYGRSDEVTVTSARAAAEEVYRRERPGSGVRPGGAVEDGWEGRADVTG